MDKLAHILARDLKGALQDTLTREAGLLLLRTKRDDNTTVWVATEQDLDPMTSIETDLTLSTALKRLESPDELLRVVKVDVVEYDVMTKV